MRYDTVGADDSTVADAHARKDRGVDTNPYLVFDDDGLAIGCAAVVWVRVVVDGNQVYFRSDKYIVADGNAAPSEEGTALLNPTTFADLNMFAIVYIERGKQGGGWVYLLSGNAAQVSAYLFRRVIACVQFVSQLHVVEDGADELVITRFVGRNHGARKIFLKKCPYKFLFTLFGFI